MDKLDQSSIEQIIGVYLQNNVTIKEEPTTTNDESMAKQTSQAQIPETKKLDEKSNHDIYRLADIKKEPLDDSKDNKYCLLQKKSLTIAYECVDLVRTSILNQSLLFLSLYES